VITLMIETTWDKRRILEVYLNVAEWGNGVFGAEAAARHYYGRPAASLGPGEAARLAVMLPNPRHYERNYGARLASHAARVQRRMIHSQVP
jgi:monofunctional biosynthetic peptidoglycan transglycosylase